MNLSHNDTTSNTDTTLDALALEARDLYRAGLEAWIACGHKLLEAKRAAPHGSWLPWLAQAGIPERTASRMMRIAGAGLKSASVANLGGPRASDDYLNALKRARRNWQDSRRSDELGELIEAVAPTFGDPLAIAFWQVDLDAWCAWAAGGPAADRELPGPAERFVHQVNAAPFWQRLREGVER